MPDDHAWVRAGPGQGFDWNRYDLPVPQLPATLENLRILHLSDTHLTSHWHGWFEALIARIRRDPPDLILFTGDFVDHKMDHRPALPILARFFTQLSARLGIYAVTGNHDGDLLGPRLQGWGVNFINRTCVRLESDRAAIELIGLPSIQREDFDPDFVSQIADHAVGVPRIILGHYPDQVRFVASLQADAMLVGHTHGGQICLPGGIPLMTHDTLPRSMAKGAHRVGKTLLVVNRGLGRMRWTLRLFCPAEVVELKLKPAERE
jgi:uncharacterized protein